jgi:hypothetical protein
MPLRVGAALAGWQAWVSTITDHQAKLFARELLGVSPAGETARIGSALMDAQVDLNPHQVDAALFAFRSPLSKGVILAEEIDKLDRWAEDKRAGLKADLREHDDTLKAPKRDARAASSLPDNLAIQKKIKAVESARDAAWRAYDTDARSIEQAKEALIDDVEARLAVDQTIDRVFQIRFTVT